MTISIGLNFLDSIWAPHPRGGWLFLAARGSRWHEIPIFNGRDRNKRVRNFLEMFPAKEYDLYFCPNRFSAKSRKACHALPTPYAWCDIDDANPAAFKPPAGVLWETSPRRFQGLWRFSRALPSSRAADISRYLAYEFAGDKNGWTSTKVLRIPGTYNHKRADVSPRVKLHRFQAEPISPSCLLRRAPRHKAVHVDIKQSDFNLNRAPQALLSKYARKINHAKAVYLLQQTRATERDRSKQIFIMVSAMARAHLPLEDIACLLWHSPYFRMKHGTDAAMLNREIHNIIEKLENAKKCQS